MDSTDHLSKNGRGIPRHVCSPEVDPVCQAVNGCKALESPVANARARVLGGTVHGQPVDGLVKLIDTCIEVGDRFVGHLLTTKIYVKTYVVIVIQ